MSITPHLYLEIDFKISHSENNDIIGTNYLQT